ncbi:putative S-locus glycoprotein [Helianthus anomalus]
MIMINNYYPAIIYLHSKATSHTKIITSHKQPNGHIERLLWTDSKQEWTLYMPPVSNQCDWYAVCGPFGTCNINNSPWRGADSLQGCRRTIPLDCGPGEGFNKYFNLKLPDTQGSWYNQTMTLVECEKMCKSNCSCTAYTNSNVSGAGSGCLLWFGDLIDIRTFAENGDTLYIQMAPSELGKLKQYFYFHFYFYLHRKHLGMNILFWHRLPRKHVKCNDQSESCGPHSNCDFGHPSFNMLILLFQ